MFKIPWLCLVGIIMVGKKFLQLKNLVLMANSKNSKSKIRNFYKDLTSLPTTRITVFLFLDMKTLTWNTTLKPIKWNNLKLNSKKMTNSNIFIKHTITMVKYICLVLDILTLLINKQNKFRLLEKKLLKKMMMKKMMMIINYNNFK